MTSHSHTACTTTTGGLNRSSPPMRLFEKAKKYGIWNPADIDLTQDAKDWQTLTPEEQQVLLHLTANFAAGEEAVTLDLLPLMMSIAQEGRIEEEMFLTTFLWEEAKHTDFFDRFLQEVAGSPTDLAHFHGTNYRSLVYETLPAALNALRDGASPQTQIRASVVYNMIVEGTLAETGYHAYYQIIEKRGILPGTQVAITKLKQDESRHIAYGIFLISRLLAEHPHLWDEVEAQLNAGLMQVIGIVNDIFAEYDPMPFGLEMDAFVSYAMLQYQKRYIRIDGSRESSLTDVSQMALEFIESGDA